MADAGEGVTPELERLWREAQDALESGERARALALADALAELRHASGYEVRARVLWSEGRVREALPVLAEGVARAPRVWRLWELFGSLQAECGLLEEADASYRNAARCPEAEHVSIGYHVALLRVRQGRLEEALDATAVLAQLGAAVLGKRLGLLRVRLFNALGRHADALEEADGALAPGPTAPDEAALAAAIHAERGKACWKATGDRARVLADLRAARELAARAGAAAGPALGTAEHEDLARLLAELANSLEE